MNPKPNELPLVDHLLLNHGTATMCSVGSALFLFGILGLHWINRRRFYRRKLAEPFKSYFLYWLTRSIEGWLGILFLLSSCIGVLCFLGGVIDWIDG